MQGLLDGCSKHSEATDEAQALEHSGYRPAIVPGGAHNIKVSLPEDLALAEFYLKRWVGSE